MRSDSAPVFCAMRRFRIWVGEPLGAPAGEDADQEGALIRPLRGTSPLGERKARAGGPVCRPYRPHPPRFARHLPLKGKACGRLIAAPTVFQWNIYPWTGGSRTCPYGGHRSRPPFRRERSQTDPPITDQPPPARPSQARLWNRIRRNFRTARPQWAGRNRGTPLRFCAPEVQ